MGIPVTCLNISFPNLIRQLSSRKQSISQTSSQDQYRQLFNLELEKKALFLLITIKVVFSLAKAFSISPISLFFTKCSGKDVYNVEKSKVLISETMLRLDLIAFIISMELSKDQSKLTPEFSYTF